MVAAGVQCIVQRSRRGNEDMNEEDMITVGLGEAPDDI
jgi:hypothetical protein